MFDHSYLGRTLFIFAGVSLSTLNTLPALQPRANAHHATVDHRIPTGDPLAACNKRKIDAHRRRGEGERIRKMFNIRLMSLLPQGRQSPRGGEEALISS